MRRASRKKKFGYLIQGALARLLFAFFRLLPLDVSSALGGWLGRTVGPYLRWHRTAKINLMHIWPEREAEHPAILKGMWDNLGRTLAEYSWLSSPVLANRIQMTPEAEQLLAEARQENLDGIIFSAGHLANWELAPLTAALKGIPLTLIYRHANNPAIDKMIRRIRSGHFTAMLPKGRKGALGLIKALSQRQSVGVLIDQKMNDGISVPLLGKPAMTAPATAELSLRFKVPIYMSRIIRTRGAHFTVELIKMPPPPEADSHEAKVAAIMRAINDQFSLWITEYPAQWLWVHRRWGKLL